MRPRRWSILATVLILGCAFDPANPSVETRHYLIRAEGTFGPIAIGLATAAGSPTTVAGWAQLPPRPGLLFVRGRGTVLDTNAAIDLTLEDGTAIGTLALGGGPELFVGSFIGAGDQTPRRATMTAVDNLPTGSYLAAIDGAPDAPGRGTVSFGCGPDGARLLLVDPTGGPLFEVQVVGPTARFGVGSIPLGRPGGARGTIRAGGDPSPALPFVSGVLTIKQSDSLRLVGRVQGVARLASGGDAISISASISAAGPDGSCR